MDCLKEEVSEALNAFATYAKKFQEENNLLERGLSYYREHCYAMRQDRCEVSAKTLWAAQR